MIPKSSAEKLIQWVTAEAVEKELDKKITNKELTVYVDVSPVKAETLTEVMATFEGGGWKVEISPLRTPHGYRIQLK